MTVSMRLLSAGEGYKYLHKTVAAGDGNRSLVDPLARYYTEAGTPPEFWIGSAVRDLGDSSLRVGDEVSEEQLTRLLGAGRDPITGAPLGRAWPKYRSVDERVQARVARLDRRLGAERRAEAVETIRAEERERGRRTAVAGYDYTFSVPKSVSALWAVADGGTQAVIARAHHRAVAEVIDLLEREVAATRVGADAGDGSVVHMTCRAWWPPLTTITTRAPATRSCTRMS